MSILDYIPSPAGGSLTGYRSDQKGFVNIATESVWIAVFVFFLCYQLFILLDPWVRLEKEKGAQDSSLEITQDSSLDITQDDSRMSQIAGMGCAFRDSYLILLGSALIGMTGYGFYGSSLTLIWILFALLLIWSFSQLIPQTLLKGLLELSSVFIAMVLVIIIWGMAYYKPQIPGFA